MAKDRCVSRQARCAKKFDTGLSFLRFFTCLRQRGNGPIALVAQQNRCRVLQAIKNNPWIRRFAWLVLCWGGAWLLGWLVVPPLAQSQIERHASEALGRKLTVERVEFLPWTLEATLHGVALASKDGSSEPVRVGRLSLAADSCSL